MKQNKNYFKLMIAFVALAVVIISMLLVDNQFKPETNQGATKITIEVVIPEEETEAFTLHTDGEDIRHRYEV